MKITGCFFILLLFVFAGCGNKYEISPAVYHWKTVYGPSSYEENFLKKNEVDIIYLHFFDIVWNDQLNMVKPVAMLDIKQAIDSSTEIIPVIFITNQAIMNSDSNAIVQLAANICDKTGSMISAFSVKGVHEIQIDCDWSIITRDKYFYLLTLLRNDSFLEQKKLSCTIRLHQVKYRNRTGIPPVDKGLLMCYNTGSLYEYKTKNSILDPEEMKKYLIKQKPYELPLDLALPVFSWGVVFHDQKFVMLVNEIRAEELAENTTYKKTGDQRYKADQDNLLHGIVIKKGDEIRIEQPDENVVTEAKKYCLKIIKNKELNVVLYHLDSLSISKYQDRFYQNIYH